MLPSDPKLLHVLVLIIAGASIACSGHGGRSSAHPPPMTPAQHPSGPAAAPKDEAPLAVVELGNPTQHFHSLPVRVADESTTAILDTGIGLALVSKDLCDRIACKLDGEFTGRRMSGQAVPLTFANSKAHGQLGLHAMFQDIIHDGLVGVEFMSHYAITFDLAQARVIIDPA